MLPHRDQPGAVRALDVGHRMITDEHRLVSRNAATRERAAEDFGVGLAHAFLLRHEDRIERRREAQRSYLAPLPRTGAVRDDTELQAPRTQPGERAARVVR